MAVTSALVDSTERSGSTGTTSTVTGVTFGSAFAGRVVVVFGLTANAAQVKPTSATIGGVSANIVGDASGGGASGLFILSAVVPTGTSGNVVCTFAASETLVTAGALALTGANSAVPSDSFAVASSGSTIDVGAGGAVAGYALAISGGTGSWTGINANVTTNTNAIGFGVTSSFGSLDTAGALVGQTIDYSIAGIALAAAFDEDAGGAQNLDPSLFTNTNSFYASTVINRGQLLGTLQANNNTIPKNFSATGSVPVSIGDLVVSVVCQQTTRTVTGVTDNLGNSYSAQNAGTDAGAVTGRVFMSRVTTAGTLTSVTAACTTSANDGVHIVGVFRGPFTSLDVNPANITSDVTSPFTCPASGTLAQAAEMVFQWAVANHSTSWSTSSPGTQAIQLANSTTIKAVLGSRIVSATTSVSPAFTAGANPTQAVLGTFSWRFTADQTLTPGLFTSTNTFYAATVSQSGAQTLTPSLFTSTNTFYAATVTAGAVTLTPGLYTDADTFYAPTVNATYSLTPGLYTDADTFYGPTVAPGAVTLTPGLFTSTNTFYAPTVTRGTVTLTPGLYTDADTFYGPTVTQGAVTLQPPLYTDADTFYAPTVAAGAVTLTPGLYTDADTFYAATVVPGTITLTPPLYTDADTFYAPTVTQGGVTLTPGLFTSANTFYAPTVTAGAVTLTPSLFTDADVFYAPIVVQGQLLQPPYFVNTNTFYVTTVTPGGIALTPGLYTDADTFYAPTVTRGTVTLTPGLYTDADTFYAATVSQAGGTQTLTPPLYTDADAFYAPTVAPGAVALLPDLFLSSNIFYAPTVTQAVDATLLPEFTVDADEFYAPTVTSSVAITYRKDVRVEYFNVDPNAGIDFTSIEEVYMWFGTEADRYTSMEQGLAITAARVAGTGRIYDSHTMTSTPYDGAIRRYYIQVTYRIKPPVIVPLNPNNLNGGGRRRPTQ